MIASCWNLDETSKLVVLDYVSKFRPEKIFAIHFTTEKICELVVG